MGGNGFEIGEDRMRGGRYPELVKVREEGREELLLYCWLLSFVCIFIVVLLYRLSLSVLGCFCLSVCILLSLSTLIDPSLVPVHPEAKR